MPLDPQHAGPHDPVAAVFSSVVAGSRRGRRRLVSHAPRPSVVGDPELRCLAHRSVTGGRARANPEGHLGARPRRAVSWSPLLADRLDGPLYYRSQSRLLLDRLLYEASRPAGSPGESAVPYPPYTHRLRLPAATPLVAPALPGLCRLRSSERNRELCLLRVWARQDGLSGDVDRLHRVRLLAPTLLHSAEGGVSRALTEQVRLCYQGVERTDPA